VLQYFVTISLFFIYLSPLHSYVTPEDLSKESLIELKENQIYISGDVSNKIVSNKKFQELKLTGASFHQKSCKDVFKVLGDYENYEKFIDFIKVSKYDPKTQRINFTLSHLLLPFDMYLIFKIPRIKGAGKYKFIFEIGFLKGLEGKILIRENQVTNALCFISLDIHWLGSPSPIPNFIFSFFSKRLLRGAIQELWKKSGHKF